MKTLLRILLFTLAIPAFGQELWVNLLSGPGANTPDSTASAPARGIHWQYSGIGLGTGIPSCWNGQGSNCWTQSGSTILAASAPCSNGSGDCTSTIQTALNACGGTAGAGNGKYVLLGSGTFKIAGTLTLSASTSGNYCELRGSGANNTILNCTSASAGCIYIGDTGASASVSAAGAVAINSGATFNSTSVTLASGSHTQGDLLYISQLNNPSYVDQNGDNGNTTNFCVSGWGYADITPSQYKGSGRTKCQIVKITNVASQVLTVTPPLWSNYNETLPSWTASTYYGFLAYITDGSFIYEQNAAYTTNTNASFHCLSGGSIALNQTPGSDTTDNTCSWHNEGAGTTAQPQAIEFTPKSINNGVVSLQIYDNDSDTGGALDIAMSSCDECWVAGNLVNFTEGDYTFDQQSFGDEIRDNYFSGAYLHTSGVYDSTNQQTYGSSNGKFENNICERGHVGCWLAERGGGGWVYDYNYVLGAFDGNTSTTRNFWNINGGDWHGATRQFDLSEGNVMNEIHADCVWGCPVYLTSFRNNLVGYSFQCTLVGTSIARGSTTCSPLGYPGLTGENSSWFGSYTAQVDGGVLDDYFSFFNNHIGDITGSTQAQSAQNFGGAVIPQQDLKVWSSADNSVAVPYQAYWGMKFGFGPTNDCNGSPSTPCYPSDSAVPYTTALVHGWYDNHRGTITWSGAITHTLPASFIYTVRPAWYPASVPFPAHGPDVAGGIGPGGHTNLIPAQIYYNTISGNTLMVGSPFTTFNAITGYYNSQSATGGSAATGGVRITGGAVLQ